MYIQEFEKILLEKQRDLIAVLTKVGKEKEVYFTYDEPQEDYITLAKEGFLKEVKHTSDNGLFMYGTTYKLSNKGKNFSHKYTLSRQWK